MVAGVGCDILQYHRIREEILKDDDAFVARIFTRNEISEAEKKDDRRQYFAGLYAAKEAVFKALRLKPDGFEFKEIEIAHDENGAPAVFFQGKLGKYVQENNIRIHVSISYESDQVLSFAVAEIINNQMEE